VSPLWRDEVTIHLAPRKVALVRHARGLRRRAVASVEVPVPTGSVADVGPTLERLAGVLADATWHDAVVRAVVADPWARFGIVPWPEAHLDEAGRMTHARYLLGDAYGEAVGDWDVTLADAPPGRPYVACGMPANLRPRLEEALAPAHLRLVSLQPRLVVSFNAWRHRLPADATWFVSVDDGALSAVHLRQGAWDRVYMARLSSNWGAELERLQAFARVTRAAGALDRMFVDAPRSMRLGAAANAGIEWLGEGAGPQPHELQPTRTHA
jgi:hypothetical protein